MKVELATQVVEFVRGLPPDPKRLLRLVLHALEEERGDIKALTDELTGYYRLRVGRYRVIFRHAIKEGSPIICCDYAEKRAVIYSQFKPEP